MNLNLQSISFLWRPCHRLLRIQLIRTNASISSFSTSSELIDHLHLRILRVEESSVLIVPILNQWLEERKRFELRELRKCIKELREHCRYNHALQVSEWMTAQNGYKLWSSDVAVRLYLISKTHGLAKAEEYFKSIPQDLRNYQVYGALLHCYPRSQQLEKVEALMQSMKEMGFVKTAACYHTLLNLYSRMGTSEKPYLLMDEMEEKGVIRSRFTYNVWLRAYVACSDIESMEKLLVKMQANPRIRMTFDSCIIAANGYLKAGLFDKTLMMLKRSEELISEGMRKAAYETLFGLYAAIGNESDVYRLWKLHKQIGRVSDTGYVCMISALLKLADLDAAEKIWEEWDSGKNGFNIRIMNLMINAYSKKGYIEKAEAYINKIVEKGEEPNANSWDLLVDGYLLDGQITKAVETMKKVILKSKPGRIPRITTFIRCIEHLKGKGDKETADALLKMTNEHCHMSTDAYNRLSLSVSDEALASTELGQNGDDDQTSDESPTEAAWPEKETM